MGKASKIILGLISGFSVVLQLLAFLLQVASITYYAVIVQSNSSNIEYYVLMAIPALTSALTVFLAAIFFYDQVLMRRIRERNSKVYQVLSRNCCRSCCLQIFNVTHKSLSLAYIVSSVATVGTSLMSGILSGAVMRGVTVVDDNRRESVPLWFSSMVVCFVFGLVSVLDSLLIMMRNYEKKDITIPASTMSSQLMETQSNAGSSPYDYKNEQ